MTKNNSNSDVYMSWFWGVFIGSILISSLLCILILIDSFNTHELCISYKCVNFFFKDMMFVPISVLASALPICAVFIALHKSHQTKLQIIIAQKQNNTSNLFVHKKEFSALCESLEKKYPVFIDWQSTYRKIFPNNNLIQDVNTSDLSLAYDKTTSDYFEFDTQVLSFLNEINDKDYMANFDDTYKAAFMIENLVLNSDINFQSQSPFFKMDNGHLVELAIHNHSVSDSWKLYQVIMEELAFFCDAELKITKELVFSTIKLDQIREFYDRLEYRG